MAAHLVRGRGRGWGGREGQGVAGQRDEGGTKGVDSGTRLDGGGEEGAGGEVENDELLHALVRVRVRVRIRVGVGVGARASVGDGDGVRVRVGPTSSAKPSAASFGWRPKYAWVG